jgi:hypothetical protein
MATPRSEPTTNAEAEELRDFLEKGARTTVEVESSFQAPQPVTVPFGRPTPVTIAAQPQQVLDQLGDDEAKHAFVELEFGNTVASEDFSVLVFLNNDRATAQTPPDDPSYVGALAFFCHGENRGGTFVCMLEQNETLRYRFDITEKLRSGVASPGASPTAPATTTTTRVRPQAADNNLKVNLVTVPFADRRPSGKELQVTAAKVELIRSQIEESS